MKINEIITESNERLNEFAPSGNGDDGGFDEEMLRQLAAQWWNGDRDPRVEQVLTSAGWEIGEVEDGEEGGAFVVQSGDEDGGSYMSWSAEELEGLSEGKTGPGLWANIHAKRKRGAKMRKKGAPGAPTEKALKAAQAGSKNESVTEGWVDTIKNIFKRKPRDNRTVFEKDPEAMREFERSGGYDAGLDITGWQIGWFAAEHAQGDTMNQAFSKLYYGGGSPVPFDNRSFKLAWVAYNKHHGPQVAMEQGVAEDTVNESSTIDFIRGLISEFNTQMSGSPYYPMDYKNPGMRMWTRGDGSRYKDPGYIFIDRDLKPEDQPKWHKAKAVEKFWKFLESKGARKIGDVSGEFGSDPHSPAVVLNKQVFVFNGRSIAWGSTSRLKNSSVWRQKQQGVAEGWKQKVGAGLTAAALATGAGGIVLNPNRIIDGSGRSAANPYGNVNSMGHPIKKPVAKPEDDSWSKIEKRKAADKKKPLEETYHDDDLFFEAYGVMEYNDEMINESEYQGRKVTLNKPMQGDVKKFKVYVKNEKGNVVKVNFGDPNSTIKKNNPARRKSFRARHNCDNPGPKTGARYWSCRKW